MAKKTCSFQIDERVVAAIAENAEALGMTKSQFVDFVLGTSCGVYSTSAVVGTLIESTRSKSADTLVDTAVMPA